MDYPPRTTAEAFAQLNEAVRLLFEPILTLVHWILRHLNRLLTR